MVSGTIVDNKVANSEQGQNVISNVLPVIDQVAAGLSSETEVIGSIAAEAPKTSLKKVETSRRNGKKSRGPKTSQGKGRSSLNSITHGLTVSLARVLPTEDPAEFTELRAGLFKSWQPVGFEECELVGVIVDHLWRLRRASRIEYELFLRMQLDSLELEHRRRCERLRSYSPDPLNLNQLTDNEVLRFLLDNPKFIDDLSQVDKDGLLIAIASGKAKLLADRESFKNDKSLNEAEREAIERQEPAIRIIAAERVMKGLGTSLATALIDDHRDVFGKLSRHETAIMNRLSQTESRLREMQKYRSHVVDAN
jgi:hypothetical protein